MSASSEKFELAADDLDSSLERVTASIDSIENRHEPHDSHSAVEASRTEMLFKLKYNFQIQGLQIWWINK